MSSESGESPDFVPIFLTPVNFFALEVECPATTKAGLQSLGEKYKLPDTSSLCQEESFADVAMGWSPEGLAFYVQFQTSFQQVVYPRYTFGDSVELFVDTRDLKSAGFNTRFCHHFCFLPESIEGFRAAEVTRFRTEDAHPLCDPTLLQVETALKKSSYDMKIFIPADCLYGYDPEQFDRLGFTYRINRYGKPPQHFCVVSSEYQIDQLPALWGSVRLQK